MLDWKLFVLLAGADWISAVQANIDRRIAAHNRPALLPWFFGRVGAVFMVVKMPLGWVNVIVRIVMLFWYPGGWR